MCFYFLVVFIFFIFSNEFEVCRSCDCDFVTIENSYGDLDTGSKACGRYSRNHIEYSNQVRGKAPAQSSTADDLYIRIKTDDTVHYKGINISYIVKSDSSKLQQMTTFLHSYLEIYRFLMERMCNICRVSSTKQGDSVESFPKSNIRLPSNASCD